MTDRTLTADAKVAWRRTYISCMVRRGVSEDDAAANFDAVGFGPDGFSLDDNPEDCADDEMSYWSDDGDE